MLVLLRSRRHHIIWKQDQEIGRRVAEKSSTYLTIRSTHQADTGICTPLCTVYISRIGDVEDKMIGEYSTAEEAICHSPYAFSAVL